MILLLMFSLFIYKDTIDISKYIIKVNGSKSIIKKTYSDSIQVRILDLNLKAPLLNVAVGAFLNNLGKFLMVP